MTFSIPEITPDQRTQDAGATIKVKGKDNRPGDFYHVY